LARYNTFKYGSGQTYGEIAASAYSVAPFAAYAFDYQKVYLTWATPQSVSGNPITTFQIVRNQYAYSETQTDGVILWTNSVAPSGNLLYDTNQLASGRFAFYSIWLKLQDNSWVLAGTAEVLVPAKHSSRIYPKYIDETNTAVPADILLQTTHERFLNYIPKVFTSNQGITDNLDKSSDLSMFLEGFSFTVDEFLTYSQLVLPGLSGKYSNASIVKLQGNQLGVPEDTQGLTKTQKYLVRDSIYIYSRKGTLAGLNRFVKAITGYVPTITVSSNLMLSLQESTFYNGVGNWKPANGAVSMTATNTSDVPILGGTASSASGTSGTSTLTITNTGFTIAIGQLVTGNSGIPSGAVVTSTTAPFGTGITVTIDKVLTSNLSSATGVTFVNVNDLIVDNNWIATIVASSGTYPSITLGMDSPILTGIPVVAGQEYSFSYWVKRNSTSGSIFGQSITWYNQQGVKINDSPTQVGQTVTTSWVKKTYTRTAPAGAVFAGLGLTFTSGPTFYLDRVQFALSSESNYSESRSIKISVASDAATRLTKIPRLNFEITKYLPINKAYFITSSSGFESSGISS
jgi:hypothetical protein